MNNKIRVGIIGVSPDSGWAAISHIPALKLLPDYQLTAISNRNQEKAVAAAKAFDVPHIYRDNLELIQSPEVDLVVVSVKVPEHRKLLIEAIDAGKMIYCEWPLGNGLAEAIEINALAKAKGVHGTIGLQTRAVPAVQYVKDLITEGYIGEVLSTSIIGSGIIYGAVMDQSKAYSADIKNGAGMIYATMGHAIDALNFMMGEFTELTATVTNRRKTTTILETGEVIPMTAYDQIAFSGILENAAVASVHYRGGTFKGTNLLWEINGTAGDLVLTSGLGHPAILDLTLSGSRGDNGVLEVMSVPQKYYYVPTAPAVPPIAYNVAQNYALLAKDLKENSHLSPDFEDAVVRHRMVEAIELSASTGTRQTYQTNELVLPVG